MPFPESPRVVYQINPLEEVICQIRFPSILRIDSTEPVGFQEKIRGQYPIFQKNSNAMLPIPSEITKALPFKFQFEGGPTVYNFLSEDEVWTFGLTRDFVSLSTRRYKRWEEFKERLELPLAAFVAEYSPAFYSRIGLRYRDLIDRAAVGYPEADWSELLQPHIAGSLADKNIAKSITGATNELLVTLNDEKGRVRVVHGLNRTENDETRYVIDSDFYVDSKMRTNDAIGVLNHFNAVSGRLFRWCITERLHEALRPDYVRR